MEPILVQFFAACITTLCHHPRPSSTSSTSSRSLIQQTPSSRPKHHVFVFVMRSGEIPALAVALAVAVAVAVALALALALAVLRQFLKEIVIPSAAEEPAVSRSYPRRSFRPSLRELLLYCGLPSPCGCCVLCGVCAGAPGVKSVAGGTVPGVNRSGCTACFGRGNPEFGIPATTPTWLSGSSDTTAPFAPAATGVPAGAAAVVSECKLGSFSAIKSAAR